MGLMGSRRDAFDTEPTRFTDGTPWSRVESPVASLLSHPTAAVTLDERSVNDG